MTSSWPRDNLRDFAPSNLLQSLGRGALGETFDARHPVSGERIAITRFHAAITADPQLALFEAEELPALLAFQCPGLVPISPFFTIGDARGFAMPFFEGEDIRRYRGRSVREILDAFEPMLKTLSDCHEAGFAHGGLHAANLLCDPDGRIQIAGLGFTELAHSIEAARTHRLRASGPELSPALRGAATKPTVGDDLFALGALLYESVSGRPLPRIDSPDAQILPPIRQPGGGEEGSRELSILIARLRQTDPNARPHSIKSVLSDLVEVRKSLPDTTSVRIRPTRLGSEGKRMDGDSSQPEKVSPRPSSAAPHKLSSPESRNAWIALLLFALLGGGLLAWLEIRPAEIPASSTESAPHRVNEPNKESKAEPKQAAPPNAPSAITSFETERLLSELVAKIPEFEERWSKLIARGVRQWAPHESASLTNTLEAFKEALNQRNAEAAEAQRKNAHTRLSALEKQAETRLTEALREGARALENNQAEQASAAFQSALALEANHPAARSGLERAKKRPAVLSLIEQAKASAARPDGLADAIRFAREARERDPEYTPSSNLLKQFEGERAKRRLTAALAAHQTRGAQFETEEKWSEAEGEYEAALARSESAAFAVSGLPRVRQRAALDAALETLTGETQKLFSRSGRTKGKAALGEAKAIQSPGPRLRAQIETMQRLLAIAETPTSVTLASDGLTEITIFHVGRQGTFEQKRLDLLPGTYTITGSRNGYRDIRRQIEVPAGVSSFDFSIRCKEAL